MRGKGTMADAVLDVCAQFGKSLVVAVGAEDGVIAESFAAAALMSNLTVDGNASL